VARIAARLFGAGLLRARPNKARDFPADGASPHVPAADIRYSIISAAMASKPGGIVSPRLRGFED
jgi:hypothetical protein